MLYCRYFMAFLAICLLGLTSCNKYLDVTPKGYTLLNTVSGYDQWLNDPALAAFPTTLDLLGDLVDQPTIPLPPALAEDRAYIWSPQFSTTLDVAPLLWGEHYARINKYNTVLNGIDAASGGTDQQKASLKAEALLGRAFEYFCLLNEYTQPYDASTAGQDPGIPFVTSSDVTQVIPSRGTVQEIYKQLFSDIQQAILNLPAVNVNNRLRPDVASAYSVLARIYLYMRDYVNATKNAQLALKHTGGVMLDYNNLPSGADTKNRLVSIRSDVIYGKTNVSVGKALAELSFSTSYNPEDIRAKWFTGAMVRGSRTFLPISSGFTFFTYTNYGTTVQEMKLIIAESAARAGDLTSALQQLNEVRIKRFAASNYQPLTSRDATLVLSWVLRERMYEFPFHGLRWFDMRRLDKEGRMATIHRYDAKGNVISTLPPHSPKYTLQIPAQVVQFNPKMEQNPWE